MVKEVGISTVSLGDSIETLCFKNGGKTEIISVSKTTASVPLSYSGTRGVIFFASEDDLNAKKPEYARVVLPEGSTRVLLAFGFAPLEEEADEKEEAKLEGKVEEKTEELLDMESRGEQEELVRTPMITAYTIESDDYKAGSYRFFNLTKEKIDLTLNEEVAVVEPNGQVTVSSPDWTTRATAVNLSATTTNEEDDVTKLYSSLWGHRPERRYMIFIAPSDDPHRPVEFRNFYDVP
jgi:hypothetical protein